MYCTKKITDSLTWIGGNDRRLAMFEGVYSVPAGVSYNSYVLKDEKIAVFDTVDKAISKVFFENLKHVLGNQSPDYLIIHHMEPDHSASISEFMIRYPHTKIVCNAKTATLMKQFFKVDNEWEFNIVSEKDTLSLGSHTLSFINAPMVHWPEVMVSYEESEGILFSADAFGHFGALNGAVFADEVDFERDFMNEARRYYTNIVGKYGSMVQSLLKKVGGLNVKMICPLHGFVWRRDIGVFIEKYDKWSRYIPEEQGVVIAYASIYGNTENAAEILASMLIERGIKTVIYDVSVTPASDILSAAFKYSYVIFASSTYNGEIFVTMDSLVRDIAAHNLQNRTYGFIQNGSWAPTSAKLMKEIIGGIKNVSFLEASVDIRSSVNEETVSGLERMADEICCNITHKCNIQAAEIERDALFKLSYGLYALFTNDGNRHNACIINTPVQLTSDPTRISICVNRSNYSCDIIKNSGVFNISILDRSVSFELFKRFGFASGRDTDKLSGFDSVAESANNLLYLTEHSNAFISARVVEYEDYGTHSLFIAEVTEAKKLSDTESVTYSYYFDNIKPKAKQNSTENVGESKKIVGWRCKICGYEYEGESLPEDYTCPLCKHPASDFEPIYG